MLSATSSKKTLIASIYEPEAIRQAAQLLERGDLIVMPTDTVYGIAGNPFNPKAIRKLYQAKNRDLGKGIPILLGNLSDLPQAVAQPDHLPAFVGRLMERLWPGALTLILPKADHLSAAISPNAGIAVRLIDFPAGRALIQAAGGILAVSSANHSGKPPARDIYQATAPFHGHIGLGLNGGLSTEMVGSTILDCTVTPPSLLRQGSVTRAQLEQEGGIEISSI